MLFYELYTYSISALCMKTLVTKLVRHYSNCYDKNDTSVETCIKVFKTQIKSSSDLSLEKTIMV